MTFTCRVFGGTLLEWRSSLITAPTLYAPGDTPPDIMNSGPFTATLISVSYNATPLNSNFTSTLQVTASRMIMRDATTVMCLSTTANKTDNFTVAGEYCTLYNYTVHFADFVYLIYTPIVYPIDQHRCYFSILVAP